MITRAFLGLNIIYLIFFVLIGITLAIAEIDDDFEALYWLALCAWWVLSINRVYLLQKYFKQYFTHKKLGTLA